MNKRASFGMIAVGMAFVGLAQAAPPKDPPTKCAPDAVLVGSGCVDKYEASVWRIPAVNLSGGSNKGLIKNVRKGKATAADLAAGDATQLGTASDNYAPCADNGQNCTDDIYAVSLPGVTPASLITWFQAHVACTNSGKSLPSNAEWQAAANGTPDPGPDNGTTDCNTASTLAVAATGSRSSCVSARGAFDMVGNLVEWVADWVPLSTSCPGWGAFSDDSMCLSGANTAATSPGALIRGGNFISGTAAGQLSVFGDSRPSSGTSNRIGFRCAR